MTMNRKGLLVIINIFFINTILFFNLLFATTGSQVSLILSHDTIQPGTQLTAYFNIKLQPGWYTYWQNPGKIGTPLSLNWQLPPKITNQLIQWPTPTLIQNNNYISYGFKNQLLVTIPLTIDPSIPYSSSVPIAVTAHWLECKDDLCVPKTQTLETDIIINNTNSYNLTAG